MEILLKLLIFVRSIHNYGKVVLAEENLKIVSFLQKHSGQGEVKKSMLN